MLQIAESALVELFLYVVIHFGITEAHMTIKRFLCRVMRCLVRPPQTGDMP